MRTTRSWAALRAAYATAAVPVDLTHGADPPGTVSQSVISRSHPALTPPPARSPLQERAVTLSYFTPARRQRRAQFFLACVLNEWTRKTGRSDRNDTPLKVQWHQHADSRHNGERTAKSEEDSCDDKTPRRGALWGGLQPGSVQTKGRRTTRPRGSGVPDKLGFFLTRERDEHNCTTKAKRAPSPRAYKKRSVELFRNLSVPLASGASRQAIGILIVGTESPLGRRCGGLLYFRGDGGAPPRALRHGSRAAS